MFLFWIMGLMKQVSMLNKLCQTDETSNNDTSASSFIGHAVRIC